MWSCHSPKFTAVGGSAPIGANLAVPTLLETIHTKNVDFNINWEKPSIITVFLLGAGWLKLQGFVDCLNFWWFSGSVHVQVDQGVICTKTKDVCLNKLSSGHLSETKTMKGKLTWLCFFLVTPLWIWPHPIVYIQIWDVWPPLMSFSTSS